MRAQHEIKYGRDGPDGNNSLMQRNQNTDEMVVNISDWQLNNFEKVVLAKREKFAAALRRIPVEDIIANVERVLGDFHQLK